MELNNNNNEFFEFEENFSNAFNPFQISKPSPPPPSSPTPAEQQPVPEVATAATATASIAHILQDLSNTSSSSSEPIFEDDEFVDSDHVPTDLAMMDKDVTPKSKPYRDMDVAPEDEVEYFENNGDGGGGGVSMCSTQDQMPDSDVMEEILCTEQQPAAESSVEVVHGRYSQEHTKRYSVQESDAQYSSSHQQSLGEATASEQAPSHPIGLSEIPFSEAITSKLRLYIDDYDEAFFSNLMRDLSGQNRVVKLDIYRGWKGETKRTRTPEDMATFFRMVASLPSLKILHLSNFVSNTDMKCFQEALTGHPTLKTIRLHLADGVLSARNLRTLITIPNLTEVTLELCESSDFSELLRSRSLQKLHIVSNQSYMFENGHLLSLVHLLEGNQGLQELELEPVMSLSAFKFLAYALRVNRALQVFRVAVESQAANLQLTDQTVQEIAVLVQTNKHLKTLHNFHFNALQVSLDSQTKLLDTFKKDCSLQHFLFFNEDCSFTAQKKTLLRNEGESQANPRFNSSSIPTASPPGDANINIQNISQSCGVLELLDVSVCVEKSKTFVRHAQFQGKQASISFWKLVDRVKSSSISAGESTTQLTRSLFAGVTTTPPVAKPAPEDDCTVASDGTLRTNNNSVYRD